MNQQNNLGEKQHRNNATLIAIIVFLLALVAALCIIIIVNFSLNSETNVDDISRDETDIEETTKDVTPKQSKQLEDYDTASIIEGDENTGYISDHIRSKAKNPKVLVVEYADLQCPGCASIMPHLHALYEKYGDRVGFIFRNFPITGHLNARSASAAVESAGLQGYYWEMLESLYANRAEWISESGNKLTQTYVSLFQEIAPGGDVEKFKAELTNPNILKKISFDYDLGRNMDKVTATPAIYVNGKAVDVISAETITDFANLIEEAIVAALNEN